jgi:hypothetical protein
MTPTPCMIWRKTLHYITKYPLSVSVYSTPHTHTHTHTHTPNQGKSIKLIEIIRHFPYNVIFLLYCTLFITELHMRPHLPRFYHKNTLLYFILSF